MRGVDPLRQAAGALPAFAAATTHATPQAHNTGVEGPSAATRMPLRSCKHWSAHFPEHFCARSPTRRSEDPSQLREGVCRWLLSLVVAHNGQELGDGSHSCKQLHYEVLSKLRRIIACQAPQEIPGHLPASSELTVKKGERVAGILSAFWGEAFFFFFFLHGGIVSWVGHEGACRSV
jgi:hypothetical protein